MTPEQKARQRIDALAFLFVPTHLCLTRCRVPALFGSVIRARREAAGLSQEALAKAAKLHRTYISMLERGERTPSLGTVLMLARALGTSMSSLVTATER